MLRVVSMHTLGKLLGLLVVRQLALHPDSVGVRGICDGTVDGAVAAALEAVVSLARPRSLPVKEDVLAQQTLGDGARLAVGKLLAVDGVAVFLLKALGIRVGAGVDGVSDSVVEATEAGLLEVAVLNGLELGADLAGALGGQHEVVQGLEVGVRAAHDEGVVARVDGGRNEGCCLGVCACNGQEIDAHDIGLRPDGNETVDVLADRYQNLSGHVAALLGAWCLILDVNTGRTLLDEQLSKLHDGRQTTVAGVRIGDNGTEVVDIGELRTLRLGCRQALVALFPVMEELRHEEVGNLVWDGGLILD